MNKYFIENNTNLIFKIILYLYYFNNYKISNNLYMDNSKNDLNNNLYNIDMDNLQNKKNSNNLYMDNSENNLNNNLK